MKNQSRKTLLICSGILIFSSCASENKSGSNEQSTIKNKDSVKLIETRINTDTLSKSKIKPLDFLKEYKGKYPNEVNLLSNPIIDKRIKNLLDEKFSFFIETWSAETPIEIRNNNFIASACEAHNCESTNFILVADLSKDILYVGVREEGKVKFYSEDGSTNDELNKWAKEY